ncbi:root hair defective 3 GTP-binding protein [Cladochytrium replicatum]|nr:root hair defective 3 GTP-binding protein [Cladochytrium replicatum]
MGEEAFDEPRLQLVNENKEFSQDVNRALKSWNLVDKGFDYNVVAVFGSQSTGKSTLLNKLFGTTFDVMNEVQRRQTTRGIWMSKSEGANILVLDVEGTDGRERGEDQDFERKSALFSIATAEVLIINMWENQVGLYNGANMGLLKTVFDVNLQLFQKKGSPKTMLLFVIRDFTSVTPLVNLQNSLMTDLDKIWASLSKPDDKPNCNIFDFFDMQFIGLPHKVFAGEQFNNGVASLKIWFTDKSLPEFVFKPNYHKHIPADGFSRFAEAIWEKIVHNRDLDLPTQQQLLAQYRCDEIMRTEYEVFTEQIKSIRPVLEAGKVYDGLGEAVTKITKERLAGFDKDGSRYHSEVYQTKRNEFNHKMVTTLHVYYLQQLRNLHRRGITLFQQTLQDLAKGDNFQFAEKMREVKKEAEQSFVNGAEAAKLEGTDWQYEEFLFQYMEEIQEIGSQKRAEAMDRMIKSLETYISDSLSEPLEVHLSAAESDMWKKIIASFRETAESAQSILTRRSKGFESSQEELSVSLRSLRYKSLDVLMTRIKEEVADDRLLMRLRNKFQDIFRYDDSGLPRVWKPGDDIDTYFTKARDEAEKLFQLFAKIDANPEDLKDYMPQEDAVDDAVVPTGESDHPLASKPAKPYAHTSSNLVILPTAKLASLKTRFRKECDAMFVEAKRTTVATTAKIPIWFVGLTIALGFNEFVAVISNPIYFIFLGFTLVGAYVVWYMGIWGPIWRATKVALQAIAEQVSDKLRDSGVDSSRLDKLDDVVELKSKGEGVRSRRSEPLLEED